MAGKNVSRMDARLPAATPRQLSAQAARLYADGPWLRRYLQTLRPFICPFHDLVREIPSGARLLDVGCGSGLLILLAAENGRLRSAVGFDANQAAIDMARQATTRAAGADGVTFYHRKVEAAWPDGPFDVVSMIDVLHHIPPASKRAVVESAVGHVGAGGLFLYKDMAARPVWGAWANRIHDLMMAGDWISYTSLDEVIAWVAASGLTLERTASTRMLWYYHQTAVFRRRN